MVFDYLAQFFVFLLGLCIGSFLNCVIYRLEQKKSISGRSFCPHCKYSLAWKDLVPVLSFAFLSGKCRYCRKRISWQYPAVEISTGLIFLLIFNFVKFNFVSLAFLFYVASALIIIFIYDLKHYIIPDKILLPAIIIAFAYRIFESPVAFHNYLLAAIMASGFFFAIFLVSAGKWMGFGDVKLAVLMGLLLGVKNVLTALFLAFLFGSIIGLMLMILKKKGLKSEIPFGPFLIAGTFFALFYGQQIASAYFNLFSI